MKTLYQIKAFFFGSSEKLLERLIRRGADILYSSEDEQTIEIMAFFDELPQLEDIKEIQSCTSTCLPATDWQLQWAEHGHGYSDGYVHLDLNDYVPGARTLRLEAGPGFGDFSHPTTQLSLQLLSEYNDQFLIDIGCGSGILALAAVEIGAPHAIGIDIDPEAIEHSKKNSRHNDLSRQCDFLLLDEFQWQLKDQPIAIVMNMIQCEQVQAWSSLEHLHQQPAIIITSGIQSDNVKVYLEQTKIWNWELVKQIEKEGWSAFVFWIRVDKQKLNTSNDLVFSPRNTDNQ